MFQAFNLGLSFQEVEMVTSNKAILKLSGAFCGLNLKHSSVNILNRIYVHYNPGGLVCTLGQEKVNFLLYQIF